MNINLPDTFLDHHRLVSTVFIDLLLYRINEALSDGDSLTTTRLVVSEELAPINDYVYRIDVIVEAYQVMNDNDLVVNFGPKSIASHHLTTLDDLTQRLREILMETDSTMVARNSEWTEYYEDEEIDHEGYAPCHPCHDPMTTPPMLEKHGWPETHEELCNQARFGGLTPWQIRNPRH